MRRFALGAFALALLASCQKKDPVIVDVDAAVFVNPFPSLADRPIPSAPTAQSDGAAASTGGFTDLFVADSDAGDADPALLTKKPGFVKYTNEPFGFAVDVPKALASKGPFADGTGDHWELGNQVAMTASASVFDALPDHICSSGPDVTTRRETAASCTATGKRGGMLFWERHSIVAKNDYAIVVEYRAELEKPMLPILLHVQRSWSITGPQK